MGNDAEATSLASEPDPETRLPLRSWLSHLRILGELPHASRLLIPGIVGMVRRRLQARAGSYEWLRPGTFEPESIWLELPDRSTLRWVAQCDRHRADDEDESMARGAPRRCCIPFASQQGSTHGLLRLNRGLQQPPFSARDQDLLERARTEVGILDRAGGPYQSLPPAPVRLVARAHLTFDVCGVPRSRCCNALQILRLAKSAEVSPFQVDRGELSALPQPVQGEFRRLIEQPVATAAASWTLSLPHGVFRFAAELMLPTNDPGPAGAPASDAQWLLTIDHLEPRDLTLARRLAGWRLSPQEKRILIASTRDISMARMAEALALTHGCLKSYVNHLLQRYGAGSREELVQRVLMEPPGGRELVGLPNA